MGVSDVVVGSMLLSLCPIPPSPGQTNARANGSAALLWKPVRFDVNRVIVALRANSYPKKCIDMAIAMESVARCSGDRDEKGEREERRVVDFDVAAAPPLIAKAVRGDAGGRTTVEVKLLNTIFYESDVV